MQQIVSITSRGQLTLPKLILEEFGIVGSTKAVVQKKGQTIIVKPRKDFWSLEGSLKSDITLSDVELKKARDEFSRKWGKM